MIIENYNIYKININNIIIIIYMIIFLVSYRARGNQSFRKEQIRAMINNINTYFNNHNVEYKIVICEQNDDKLFNRGKLLNVAFIESEKLFNFKKLYFHINIDYFGWRIKIFFYLY
jgi:archaellin